jgi:gamma-glutamyl:cysteine ligase YbdK (ATP-grasp superfamily)
VIRQVCAFEQITIGELIKSDILPDIPTARHVMRDLRAQLASLVEEGGLALVNVGTHPMAIWLNEPRSLYERYSQLEQAFQDVARSILIFARHIHIGIESHRRAVALMDQLVTEAEIIAFCRAHLAHFK